MFLSWIIANGGFSQNIEMLTACAPSGNNNKGAKGSSEVVGDGIKMAQEVGADLWAMHGTLESMGILGAPNAYFTPFIEYTLIVNNKGLRFISAGCHANGEGSEVENGSCLECHGSRDTLKEKTLRMQINPHDAPHFGMDSCTMCHHGHSEFENACLGCHLE
ncbi:MAG: cytochrome c3 family protein [Spirochaetia bacterium]|nr:cytochrome c3 family protein [Spirochaetia bacterium]